MHSSTSATSRRDQTPVLFYPAFVGFFGSFLHTKKEHKALAEEKK